MSWFTHRKPITPRPSADESSRELERVLEEHEWVKGRHRLIQAIVADLRLAREVNHFAERIRAAYGEGSS